MADPGRDSVRGPPASRNWPVVVTAAILPICCLAPLLLASLGAWPAALGLDLAGPLALAAVGLSFGAGLIAFRLHRARGPGKADLTESRDICG